MPAPISQEERRHPRRPDQAGAGQVLRAVPRRRRSVSVDLVLGVGDLGHSLSLLPVDQILHERVELLVRERFAVRRRHHVGLIAADDVRVRVDDRRRAGTPRAARPPGSTAFSDGPTWASVPGRLELVAAAAARRSRRSPRPRSRRHRPPAAPARNSSYAARSPPAPARASSSGRARRAPCRRAGTRPPSSA